MSERIIKSRRKGVEKMMSSVDPLAAKVGTELDPGTSQQLRLLDFDGNLGDLPKAMELKRVETLTNLINGKSLVAMTKSDVKREWLWDSRYLKSGDSMMVIKILSGTMPHRINMTRGRKNQLEKLCRKCKTAAETDLHVLQTCPRIKQKKLVSKRHNLVVNKIAKELKKARPNAEVFTERRWNYATTYCVPDISILEENLWQILDVRISYVHSTERLDQGEREKERKYRLIFGSEAVVGMTPDQRIEYYGICIGAAGTIDKRTITKLAYVKYPRKKIPHLAITAAQGSAQIMRSHFT